MLWNITQLGTSTGTRKFTSVPMETINHPEEGRSELIVSVGDKRLLTLWDYKVQVNWKGLLIFGIEEYTVAVYSPRCLMDSLIRICFLSTEYVPNESRLWTGSLDEDGGQHEIRYAPVRFSAEAVMLNSSDERDSMGNGSSVI